MRSTPVSYVLNLIFSGKLQNMDNFLVLSKKTTCTNCNKSSYNYKTSNNNSCCNYTLTNFGGLLFSIYGYTVIVWWQASTIINFNVKQNVHRCLTRFCSRELFAVFNVEFKSFYELGSS